MKVMRSNESNERNETNQSNETNETNETLKGGKVPNKYSFCLFTNPMDSKDIDIINYFASKPTEETETERRICVYPLKMNRSSESLFDSNKSRTARYHRHFGWWECLAHQSITPVNLYFLVISVLKWIPQVTIDDTGFSTLVPLVIFISLGTILTLVQDNKRLRIDNEYNSRTVQVMKSGKTSYYWQVTLWMDLRVGDRVLLQKDDHVPADIFICNTSDDSGECFVDCSNMNGDLNLTSKQVVPFVHENIKTPFDFGDFPG
jgi:magnesium-transporting ATPase (P-type)